MSYEGVTMKEQESLKGPEGFFQGKSWTEESQVRLVLWKSLAFLQGVNESFHDLLREKSFSFVALFSYTLQ
jgi:hypothetical protein